MEKIVVGFLGCGNIGCGVYKLLETYGAQIEENEGVGFEVRKILVRSLNKSRAWAIPSTLLTDRPEDVLDNPEIDMVMEFMGGEQPAASYMVRALENGKCVITANKMALATHWTQIVRAAREHAAGLYYEASVCGAVPIIRAINGSLQANRISSVMGIINGTTNYILTRMANEGAAYADVLADAQRLGLAEPDPTADVEGYDAAYKLSILSTLAFHRHVPVENVYREGITGITPLDVQCGKEFGLTLKLLAVAKEENGEIQAHACGEMMFYGRGAGDLPTASALVSDLICAAKAKRHELPAVSEAPCRMAEDWHCVHFVRMRAKDEPGVLSLITGGFAAEGVSIASMVQKGERDEAGFVQLIFLTHRAGEHAVRRALGFRAGERRKRDPRRRIKSTYRKIQMTLCCCIAFFLWKSAKVLKKTVKISICARCTRTVRKPTHKEKRMKCANLKKRKRIAGSRRNGRIKHVEKARNGSKKEKM